MDGLARVLGESLGILSDRAREPEVLRPREGR
jgi:hypothetical protein